MLRYVASVTEDAIRVGLKSVPAGMHHPLPCNDNVGKGTMSFQCKVFVMCSAYAGSALGVLRGTQNLVHRLHIRGIFRQSYLLIHGGRWHSLQLDTARL